MVGSTTQDTKISIDTGDLGTKIDSLKGAITQAINGINTSVGDKQSNFENALTRAVDHSIQISSARLNEFFATSVSKASKEVIQYETIINGILTRIEKSHIVEESSKHTVNFEQQRMDAHSSQNQLIADQKKAFTDFKDALKQVASRLLNVSMMYDKMDQMQDMHNLAQSTHTDVGNVAYFKAMGQLSSKVDPAYLEDLYIKMNGLYGQRNSKEFADNPLLKELSKLKGQENLVENLKKETNPDRFATMLIQAMAQGNKENAGVFAEAIKKQFGDDTAVFAFLTDLRIKLESIDTVEKARKDPSNIGDSDISLLADNSAQSLKKGADPVLDAGFNRRKEKIQKDARDMDATAQSAPVLNALNNFFEQFMRLHPEISKTALSVAALGAALDDFAKTALQIGGGLLAFKGSLKGASLLSEALGGAEIVAILSRVTPYAIPFVASYMAATAAVKNTTSNVNGTFGGVAVPKGLTDAEQVEWEKKREERIKKDYKDHAQDIATVDNNMNGQKLSFDKNLNQYVYTDPKTNKVTKMGMFLPEVGHASDEMRANSTKIQEYQQKTGTKIIMVPKAGGMFSSSSIEFVAIDADGNQVANFGRKLKISEQNMIDKTQKGSYKRIQKQGSLSTVSQAYPPPPLPEAAKSLMIKDQSVNQGLTMDINKIKEQVSTSMQLSKQLLNTPSTMQQRFNFYFTLPQTNSGRIEHSFENNSVVSRKGGGSLSNVDKAFSNWGANGTLA